MCVINSCLPNIFWLAKKYQRLSLIINFVIDDKLFSTFCICSVKPCCSAVSGDICICTKYCAAGCSAIREVRFAVGRCVSQLGGAFRNFYLQSRPAHLTWVWSALIEIYSFYAINLGPFPGPSWLNSMRHVVFFFRSSWRFFSECCECR